MPTTPVTPEPDPRARSWWSATLAAILDAVTLVVLLVAAGTLLFRGRSPPAATAVTRRTWERLLAARTDATGRDTLLFDRPGRPSLVLLYRSDCPACGRQRPSWEELTEEALAAGVEVLALTPEAPDRATAAYFSDPRIAAYSLRSPAALHEAGITQVPTTVLLTGHHTVVQLHRGLMDDTTLAHLRMALPPPQAPPSP